MYKSELFQNVTNMLDMRHYKGMMKNIRAATCDKKYYREPGGANYDPMAKRSRRSF